MSVEVWDGTGAPSAAPQIRCVGKKPIDYSKTPMADQDLRDIFLTCIGIVHFDKGVFSAWERLRQAMNEGEWVVLKVAFRDHRMLGPLDIPTDEDFAVFGPLRITRLEELNSTLSPQDNDKFDLLIVVEYAE